MKTHRTRLLLACFLAYLVTIISKMIFSASMLPIMTSLAIDKSTSALPTTYYYLAYAVAQVAFSFAIKRLPLRPIFTASLLGSALLMALIPLFPSIALICLFMALLGVVHSVIWGGCLLYTTRYFQPERAGHVIVVLSLGLPIGTGISYGASALWVAVADWRMTYYVFAALTVAVALFWEIAVRRAEGAIPMTAEATVRGLKTREHSLSRIAAVFSLLLLLNFIICVFYYGLTNWFPTLLFEVFAFPQEYSILITLLLPVIAFLGPLLAERADRRLPNSFTACLILLVIQLPLLLLLVFFYHESFLLLLALSLLMVVLVRTVMAITTSMIPLRLNRFLNAGASAMVFNAIASLGAATMPLFGVLLEKGDWGLYYRALLIGAALMCLLCVGGLFAWRRQILTPGKSEPAARAPRIH